MTSSSLVVWSDHGIQMQKGARSLMESGKFSDLEIRCQHRHFKVHKVLFSLFTDFFDHYDNLWIVLDCNPVYLEHVINFIYLGETTINYDDMEGFMKTCKELRIPLFQVASNNKDTEDENKPEETDATQFQERYELKDFTLLCRKCYKCLPNEKKMKTHVYYCQRACIFKCNLCDKAFNMKQTLRTHMISHSDAKAFSCTAKGCGKAFKYNSELHIHQSRNHSKVTFKCDLCGKDGFKTKQCMRLHRNRMHLKTRLFSCPECPRCFSGQRSLQTHIKRVHRAKDENGSIKQ